MASTTPAIAAPEPASASNISLVFGWLAGVGAVSSIAYVAAWAAIQTPILLVLAINTILGTIGVGAAWLLARRGAVRPALIVGNITLLVAALLFAAIAEALLPNLILLPVISVAMLLPYLSRTAILRMMALSIAVSASLPWVSRISPLTGQAPPFVGDLLAPLLMPAMTGAALILIWQYHGRLRGALAAAAEANAALQGAQAGLEGQVAARTAELQRALDGLAAQAGQQATLLAEVEQQREAIRELSVPVLPVARGTLVLPLVGAIDSGRIAQLQEQALGSLERSRARRLLIDVTGVPVIDTQVAKGLVEVMQATRLLGAEAMLVGIRPEVAQTIVGLGVDLGQVRTYPDLEVALERARGQDAG